MGIEHNGVGSLRRTPDRWRQLEMLLKNLSAIYLFFFAIANWCVGAFILKQSQCLMMHRKNFLSSAVVKQVLLHKGFCWLMSFLRQSFKVYAVRWKKLHVQLLGEDLCWQKRMASLATLSTVIPCVFVNSAMGFSAAISNWDFSFVLQDGLCGTTRLTACWTACVKSESITRDHYQSFKRQRAWKCVKAVSHPRADMAQCCFLIVKSNGVNMHRAEHRQSDRRGQHGLFSSSLQPLRVISVWKRKRWNLYTAVCCQGCEVPPSSVALFQESCHTCA